MRTSLIAYAATAAVFFAMDLVWLTTATGWLYKPRIGPLMLDKPNLPVAAVFYLIYVVGIVSFAVLPAVEQQDTTRALWGGALLGLVAYGTYDATNLATLAGWSATVSLVDWVWGTVATAVAATVGTLIVRALA